MMDLLKSNTDKGTEILAKIIAIAGGLGTFTPRKPNISNISDYENKGILYMIKDSSEFKDKKVVIAGEETQPWIGQFNSLKFQKK